MSVFKKTMLYLGLGPDEEYEFASSYENEADGPAIANIAPAQDGGAASGPVSSAGPSPAGPTVRAVPMPADREPEYEAVSPLAKESPVRRVAPVAQPARSSGSPAVRALPIKNTSKPSTVAPVSFNDAQDVADKFMANQAVIVNLQNVERDLSRRIIDFASGLCYGLGGQMERVAKDVYLLTPTDVEVAEADRESLRGR